MRRLLSVIFIFLFVSIISTANEYVVEYRNTPLIIDGVNNELVWENINSIDFINPWSEEKMPSTKFKAYHDNNYLYFLFEVEDPYVVIFENIHDEMMVARQDRVEIFFAQSPIDIPRLDGSYPNYFALEMDYHGRTLSIEADSQKNRNLDWDMETLDAKGNLTDDGYFLEGKIALEELKDLGVIHGNRIQAGVYRAEFEIVNGRETANWITWVDPKTEKPNFHINSSFGQFILKDLKK